MLNVQSYVAGRWIDPGTAARPIASAITGAPLAQAGAGDLDPDAMLTHARDHGAPALRALSFHDRARMLKALALHLTEHKQALYDISYHTGATATDHLFDIDGGIGTLFVYASKGRREMPDNHILIDGALEPLGRQGTFAGQHVYVPKHGVAVHINAFNFPVWGMLEKLAQSMLAGVPAIVKPATVTSYVTELAVRLMIDSGHIPAGALQLVCGGLDDTLDRLACQDTVTFTGSADTARMLQSNPRLLANGVTFSAEQDSLNASILAPDAAPGTPEFDILVKEAVREMTTKAGQKCTAIRRILAPEPLIDPLIEAVSARLAKITVGDPRAESTRMGALVSSDQVADVQAKTELIAGEAERVYATDLTLADDIASGAYLAPQLYHCANPDAATEVHSTEAFGPVATILPYRDLGHAIDLANRGQGSLVASLITHDPATAREVVLGMGPFHGRIYINNRDSAKEATGHGAPMPHLTHGGPGRAGGGEEQGGIRGVKHFMQRIAVQGSPDILAGVTGSYVPKAATHSRPAHPFTRRFHDLQIGEILRTDPRRITLDDIEHFAQFTGDTFYAHMDEAAAARNPFFPGRVAHGYLLLSFAAGLFVEPNEGPVLANTGLDSLRFVKPVAAGDSIQVALTVKDKKLHKPDYGEVRWYVELTNQDAETVATYDLLTMVAA